MQGRETAAAFIKITGSFFIRKRGSIKTKRAAGNSIPELFDSTMEPREIKRSKNHKNKFL